MPMLATSRSLLHRTASAIGWWASSDRASGGPAPLPHTLETIAETAVEGGYAAGIGLGFCVPLKCPAAAAFGHANLETATGVHEDSLFRIGACTRQFAAAAILLLAERSLLRLTDRLDLFLPGEPGADGVSVRDLLIADNAAYALLGKIIEHVTGESFAGFVTENLLVPAGMSASRFPDPTQITPHRASGYRLAADRAHDFRNAGAGHGAPAADGLHATASDLLLWNRALYSGRLLARATVDRMIAASAESSPCPILTPVLDRQARGFGIEVGKLFGRRAFWQRGQAPGFDTWLFHFPDDRADLALLANTEQGAATILEPMLRAILRV
jgi:D-alanyl-D-alanine carboxypeptidase